MYMHIGKTLRKTAVILCILIAFVGCSRQIPSAQMLIPQIIRSYGRSLDYDHVQKDMMLLREAAPAEYDIWHGILSRWNYVNNSMPISAEQIPAGLKTDDTLCIVVLGYALHADGTMAPELIGRLEQAHKCAEHYPEAYILCTGGGTAANNPDATEADAMAAWLAENGISAERILVENRSLTTVQNVWYSLALLREKYSQVRNLLIVTSDYHIPWGTALFEAGTALDAQKNHSSVQVAGCFAYSTDTRMDTKPYQTSGILDLYNRYQE